MKKHIWKIGAIASVFALLCVMNVWLEAFDISGAYQRARTAANSAMDSVKSTTSSFVERAKGSVASVRETLSSAKQRMSDAFYNQMKGLIGEPIAVKLNPYQNTVAQVRIGNELNTQERAYLAKRKPKVKSALEKMLGRSLNDSQVPTIALVASGGGYRAMLGTIGSLLAAEKIGILDATTYISALSGGTWALASWISTGMSLDKFKSYIMNNIVTDIHVASVLEARKIADMLSVKLLFNEPITIVDIYGGLLANRLLSHFGNDCQRVYLSQQTERVENADIPYPIYTSIDAREAVAREPHWFEYTPHEIGTPSFGVYVPTWGFGRTFDQGKSTNFAPEQSLGFMMGTFGSAFGVHFGRAWEEVTAKIPSVIIKPFIEEKLIDPNFGKRVSTSWAVVFNFMYGLANQELTARETIKFVDAGVDFNLPYPPVSGERPERKADIMFFLDFSGGSLIYSLKKTEEYARRKGLKFPTIDYSQVEQKSMSIFRDPTDPSVPVVIYLPRVSEKGLWDKYKSNPQFSHYSSIADFDFTAETNGGFADTPQFQYSRRQSEKLIDQMEFNMLVNRDKIIEVINSVIDRK